MVIIKGHPQKYMATPFLAFWLPLHAAIAGPVSEARGRFGRLSRLHWAYPDPEIGVPLDTFSLAILVRMDT